MHRVHVYIFLFQNKLAEADAAHEQRSDTASVPLESEHNKNKAGAIIKYTLICTHCKNNFLNFTEAL